MNHEQQPTTQDEALAREAAEELGRDGYLYYDQDEPTRSNPVIVSHVADIILAAFRQHAATEGVFLLKLNERLREIRAEFERMTDELRVDPDLPPPGEFISTVAECNEARSALIAFDIALRVRHRERHPWTPPPPDLSPQPALDPETRAEIDATP